MPYLARPASIVTVLFLTLCCYFAAVNAQPRGEPFDPAGSWQGSRSGSSYTVTIADVGGEWRTVWTDDNGRACWTGTLRRQGAMFVECYGPPGATCADWRWAVDGTGLLGTDAWRLSVLPDF